MEQVISMDESEVKEITTKSMDLTGQLADLFGQGNTDTIHQAIKDLRVKYKRELDSSSLFGKLDVLCQRHTGCSPHWQP